jgi:MFS family permease
MADQHTNANIQEPEAPPVYPDGLQNSFLFGGFNAMSFQIVLGSPMVLYAKSLGASATVLGIIAGMMPLLVISQIPAADYIPRIGFRRFVLAGWGTRVLFIFAMAVVPLLIPLMGSEGVLGLMLVLLFFFNLSRGISSCAWLPWITALVPVKLRGKYLATDAGVQSLASFITFLVAAGCLAGRPGPWQFAGLFFFSAVAGAISLAFLKRMPDAPVPEDARSRSGASVPWLAMAGYDPFKRLLFEVVGYAVSYGGIAAFTVVFLRVRGLSEGSILLVSSVAYLGGLSSLWLVGARLDRLGSKPVLTACSIAWFVVLAGWLAISGGAVSMRLGFVLALQFFMGLLAALVQMSNTRLAMAVIPVMGRNHFFAIYSVVANVALGVAPVVWGLLIDAIGERAPEWMGLSWNRFSVFFGAVALCWIVTLFFSRRLHEPQAVSMEQLLRDIMIQTPLRFMARFWPKV